VPIGRASCAFPSLPAR
jgi:DNA end-binding protein Ku